MTSETALRRFAQQLGLALWREGMNSLTRSQRAKHARSRQQAANATVRGTLVRPERCERCGKTSAVAIQMHHHDYDRPLDVQWLCIPCHRIADREVPRAARFGHYTVRDQRGDDVSGDLPDLEAVEAYLRGCARDARESALREALRRGICACGCGAALVGVRAEGKYATAACEAAGETRRPRPRPAVEIPQPRPVRAQPRRNEDLERAWLVAEYIEAGLPDDELEALEGEWGEAAFDRAWSQGAYLRRDALYLARRGALLRRLSAKEFEWCEAWLVAHPITPDSDAAAAANSDGVNRPIEAARHVPGA